MAVNTVTNIVQGNVPEFIAEFVDAFGNTVTPSGGSATLNITYPAGQTTATTSITMTALNNFYTATWSSAVASLGNATWTITSLGSSIPSATGTLRIITP